jgi:hypothetical protein
MRARSSRFAAAGAALTLAFSLTALPLQAAEQAYQQSQNVQSDIDKAAKQSQARIDNLSEEARTMLQEFRAARDESASLKIYNGQLRKIVESQDAEIASTRTQLDQIEGTQQKFVPFMINAVSTLDEFVSRDLPFLMDERRERVQDLQTLLDRADVTTAEKFRKIMEAYQTEIEYGRTIEAYRGDLGDDRTVRFLRIGRVALMYQTLSGRDTGYWNADAGEWQRLDGSYRSAVEHGLRIASEQAPPDLLRIPVSAPESN